MGVDIRLVGFHSEQKTPYLGILEDGLRNLLMGSLVLLFAPITVGYLADN